MSFIREQIVKRFKRSPKWNEVRDAHVKKNNTCAACGEKHGLEVHHIHDFSTNPELELEPTNLITLCGKRCHLLFGHLGDWQSINPEVIEDSNRMINKIQNRRKRDKPADDMPVDIPSGVPDFIQGV